jgi:hypothetical protein
MNFSQIEANYRDFVDTRDLDSPRGVGEALHALQDFYSHSNYVELYLLKNPEATPLDVPTFGQVMEGNDVGLKQDLRNNLRTGAFSLTDPTSAAPGTHGEINKDTPRSSRGSTKVPGVKYTLYDYARAAAQKATAEYLQRRRKELEGK